MRTLTIVAAVALGLVAWTQPAQAKELTANSIGPRGFGFLYQVQPTPATQPHNSNSTADPYAVQPPSPPPAPPNTTPSTPPPPPFAPNFYFTAGIRLLMGFDFGKSLPSLGEVINFNVCVGFGVGIAVNFTPELRVNFLPFNVDLVYTEHYYKRPGTTDHTSRSNLGHRTTFGIDLVYNELLTGFRFGRREYWFNLGSGGSPSVSLIGNDQSRLVLNLQIGAHFKAGTMAVMFEVPVDSDVADFGLYVLFHLAN